jgi:HJR/Mrr/RecB family endonuclease
MGKITPAAFDAKVTEFQKTYGFIYDEATKWIADNKADLVKKGVKIPLK